MNLRKIIAKEVIILFLYCTVIIITWSFLQFRNLYFTDKKNDLILREKYLKIELAALPKDNITELYNKIIHDFILKFEFEKKIYIVNKADEKEFFFDNFGIRKKVILLPINVTGYVDDKWGTNFYYIEIDVFRELLKNEVYRKKLYECYSINGIEIESITNRKKTIQSNNELRWWNGTCITEIDKTKSTGLDFSRPYRILSDLGTQSEFENYILKGLQFSEKTEKIKALLLSESKQNKNSIDFYNSNIWTKNEIIDFILLTSFVLGILLYPVRFSFLGIRWAILTLKKE